MPETPSHCPLCRSADSRIFDRRKFHNIEVVNRLCSHCGVVFQSPRMTAEEAAEFYEWEYRQLYQGQPDPDEKDLLIQNARAALLAEFISGVAPKVERHLDIGCSAGLTLQHFQKKFSCEGIGIEPGVAYRAYARGQGLTVYASLEELFAADQNRYDLVSLSHVLEHLTDPIAYLNLIRETLLTSTGVLLIEAPNLYAHDSFEVAHMVSYSAHTLTQALLQGGFSITKLQLHGKPRSMLFPLYITVAARLTVAKLPSRVVPEKRVWIKRYIGMKRRVILTRISPHKAWIPLDEIKASYPLQH